MAKLYSYWITVNYREAYGIFGCNGILFNHESPRRGETFVTRKITRALTNIAVGNEDCLYLGNLNAKRDWGHAKDFVRMQWLMLQQNEPNDYVIATGKQYSVKEFVKWSAEFLGIEIAFKGEGVDEVGIIKSFDKGKFPNLSIGKEIIKVDPKYYRPAEVEELLGDASKAKNDLGWKPEISAKEMCKDMIEHDLKKAVETAHLKQIK